MKRILLPLFFMFVCVFTYAQQTASCKKTQGTANSDHPVKWMVGNDVMPNHIQAFQENKGQYFNPVNSWKVLYGCDYMGSWYLFTDHGLICVVPELVPADDASLKDDQEKTGRTKEEEEKAEKQARKRIIYHNVAIEWENSSPSITCAGDGMTDYHFGAVDPVHPGKSIDNINGFKKLVYHNVYPG